MVSWLPGASYGHWYLNTVLSRMTRVCCTEKHKGKQFRRKKRTFFTCLSQEKCAEVLLCNSCASEKTE